MAVGRQVEWQEGDDHHKEGGQIETGQVKGDAAGDEKVHKQPWKVVFVSCAETVAQKTQSRQVDGFIVKALIAIFRRFPLVVNGEIGN